MSDPMVSRRPRPLDRDPDHVLDPRFEGWIRQAIHGQDRRSALVAATALLAQNVGADRISVLVPVGRRRLRIVAGSDAETVGDLIVALERYPELEQVIRSRQPVLVEDVEADELVGRVRGSLRSSGVRSIAAVPLSLADTIGVLRAVSTSHRLTRHELQLLQTAAASVESAFATAEAGSPDPTDSGWKQLAVRALGTVIEVALDGRVVEVHAGRGNPLAVPQTVRGRSLFELLPELAADPDDRTFLELVDGVQLAERRVMALTLPDRPPQLVQVVSSLHGAVARGLRIGLFAVHAPETDVLAELIHRLPLPLLTLAGPQDTVMYANPAALALLSDQSASVTGTPLSSLISSRGPTLVTLTTRPVPVAALRSSIPAGAGWSMVALLDLSRLVEAESRGAALRAKVVHQRGTVDELLRERDDFDEIRSSFLSASAHELKTPLTVIQSYLEAVLEDIGEGLTDEQRSFLEIALRSSLRLRRLVIDLVDLAAIDSGKIPLDIGRVEVGPVVDAVCRQMSELARRSSIDVARALPDVPVAARADAGRVEQIMLNLVDNALKFTPRGGSVVIRGRSRADSVRLEVCDSGIGIPADRVDLLFHEFSRLPDPDGKVRPGSGLGLAISRRLALAMGGRIEVESSPGEGSTFTLHLPRWPE